MHPASAIRLRAAHLMHTWCSQVHEMHPLRTITNRAVVRVPRRETAIDSDAIDGTAIDGTAIDDTAINGTAIDGTAIDGTTINGTAINSTAINGIVVNNGGGIVNYCALCGRALDTLLARTLMWLVPG